MPNILDKKYWKGSMVLVGNVCFSSFENSPFFCNSDNSKGIYSRYSSLFLGTHCTSNTKINADFYIYVKVHKMSTEPNKIDNKRLWDMYVYRKSAIPCMQISDCKSYSIDVRWGVNRVSRPLSVREQDKECSLYLWRIVLSQSTPFLCWHCPLSTILTNKEQMQLAFIKLMNNRFTHSQEYVEYCQIIMIIILMIKKHIVSYFMPKTIHQWLKNTNMLFHFYSLKDAFYNPVLKANIP